LSKVRVYELAKRLKMSSKQMIQELLDLGVEAKNHMSVVDEETEKLLMDLYGEKQAASKSAPPKAPPEQTPAPQPSPTEAKPSPEKGPVPEKKPPQKKEKEPGVVYINALSMTLRELCEAIKVPVNKVIQESFSSGIILNPNKKLEFEECVELAKDYGVRVEISEDEDVVDSIEDDIEKGLKEYYTRLYTERNAELTLRPPVVTVMGHVDHGKTTLLDRVRRTRVAEGEAGGITQAIGAYQVEYKKRKITFIDTPGHEAFTEMRARGAQATDIVVLVIAADDGVMPQTVEAYNHAKQANVPIIVAINKIDKPNANVDVTMQQMVSKLNLIPEDWGGDTVTVLMSAKKGEGIEDLLEMILLVSEMKDIQCFPKGKARGVIVESGLDPRTGPTATCIVKDGVLRVGQHFVCGNTSGKVKAISNDKGKKLKEGRPSDPVQILGFSEVPDAHSILYVVESPSTARNFANKVKLREKADQLKRRHISLEEFYDMVKEGERKVLKIVIKAESFGTVEALRNAIAKLQTEEITLEIVHAGIGAVSSSDVLLASASDAVILGFKVKVNRQALEDAEKEKVQIKTYDIIFNLIEDLKKALMGMLEPDSVEEIIGHGEIRQAFKIKKVGTIAGTQMLDGYVTKDSMVRVFRNGIEVFKGELDSLKHFQNDAERVDAPQECGIKLQGFNEVNEKDEVEFFVMKEVKRKLDFKNKQT